jgi:integrase
VKVNEFVPREVVDKLMKKAYPVWQVILGFSRYGGLRTPTETLSLRWDDIDWELNRMSIPEPKVEHHEGRGIRSCPIFPELVPSSTKLLRSSETKATMWSRLPSTERQPTRRWVGRTQTYEAR